MCNIIISESAILKVQIFSLKKKRTFHKNFCKNFCSSNNIMKKYMKHQPSYSFPYLCFCKPDTAIAFYYYFNDKYQE